MNLKLLAAVAAALALSGCAVQKVMTPVGGSRSDGTVKLAYTYGLFEKPVIDPAAANASARQRCAAWGYSDAEAFGGAMTQCVNTDYNGACNQWQVTVEFQCTGQPEATAGSR